MKDTYQKQQAKAKRALRRNFFMEALRPEDVAVEKQGLKTKNTTQ